LLPAFVEYAELKDLKDLWIYLIDEKVYKVGAIYETNNGLGVNDLADKASEALNLNKNCKWRAFRDHTMCSVCDGFSIRVSIKDDMTKIQIEDYLKKDEL
jgi:hypothetical protein